LEKHNLVSWVSYPALESSPDKKLADKYLKGGAGAIVGFGIKGGVESGKRL
jgi:O-acetylhomoserine (thiol)-lyase